MELGSLTHVSFIAKGTTCTGCEKIIERQAVKVDGVLDVKFDYAKEEGTVVFDGTKTDIDAILDSIEEKGYTCYIIDESDDGYNDVYATGKKLGWVVALLGLMVAGYYLFHLVDGIQLPQISQNMGYGLLFAVGLLTGFHCVSMCGGFVVSYTAKNAQAGHKSHRSHMMYAVGKTVSYTIIGAMFGLVGSIIAFTPFMRGIAGLIAGMFLVLFGLKMLNIFPVLRKIQFRTPKFISRFVGKNSQHSNPLMIGLLNGLMLACGPLQAIYVMAAGTGSIVEGAKTLFVFGLGTLPVMMGFGYFASYISGRATQKILKASGVIVIVLGLIMLNNGLTLTGTGYDVRSIITSVSAAGEPTGASTAGSSNLATIAGDYQEIRMEVNRYGWEPDKFVLKAGVPVRWIIDGKEINGCNNAIVVPKLGLDFEIKKGEQVIEFTPDQEGIIPWSCWMGMIPGTFIVKEDIDLSDSQAVQKELDQVEMPQGGTCGGAPGGGCGCGARRA